MSPLLGIVIFFLVFAGLPACLFLYAIFVKQWPFRRLTPYMIAYAGAFGALIGYGMRLRGWDLVAAIAMGMAFGWLGMTSWAKIVDPALESHRRKDSK
jgi:hypothetical protein